MLEDMDYGILGPLRAESGGRLIDVPGLKERALLGLLVVEAGTVVSSDRMIYELWRDHAPRDAPAALRTHVSRLRRVLGTDDVITHKPGYVLAVEPDRLDVGRFEHLADLAAKLRRDPGRAAAIARDGLAEWRGRALADLESFPFAEAEARRLEQRRLATLEVALDAELRTGRHTEVVPELVALTAEHPFHERFWLLLMLALYRSDRAGEALEAYGRAERELGETLGIAPSRALSSLERAIVLQDADLEPTMIVPPNNLPEELSTFVGRGREIDGLEGLFRRSRLVTLTGVGGSGKSRLALEVASRNMKRYPDGIWRVELAALRDPADVPAAVSMVLGEPGSHASDPVESLVDYLADRTVLLLLDNCEHLLTACGDLATRLGSRCGQLTLIVTSREPLRVPGETVWLVPPLTLPDPSDPSSEQEAAEAFELFRRRAEDASPAFAVNDANRPHITVLCRRLAGLPLAIELAAARSAAFTPRQLVERLSAGLDILESGPAVADRSRTMRASLEWSYRLLDDHLARLFRRLAVFVGGWYIDDAQAIVGDGADDMAGNVAALVDKSLVDVVPDRRSRYRLLEPVRDYARELFLHSGEADEIGARHAARYLAVAQDADGRLRGSEQQAALTTMEADHDNVRKALAWAIETSQPELALELVAACAWFWFMAGHWRESWTWLSKAVDAAGDEASEAWARALYTAGGMQVIRANGAAVRDDLEVALRICRDAGDRFGEAWCFHLLGHAILSDGSDDAMMKLTEGRRIFAEIGAGWEVAWSDRYLGDLLAIRGEGQRGVELQLASISAFREMGDAWSTAYGLYNVAGLMQQLPEFGPTKARPYLLRCLRISREIGDSVWEVHAMRVLGEAAYLSGSADAIEVLEDAIDRLRLLGDDTCLSASLGMVGDLKAAGGQWVDAAESTAEALRLRRRLHSTYGMVVNVIRVGLLAAGTGHHEEASRLAAAADAEAATWPASIPPLYRDMHRRLMEAAVGPDRFPAATGPIDDIVPYALEVAEAIRQEHLTDDT